MEGPEKEKERRPATPFPNRRDKYTTAAALRRIARMHHLVGDDRDLYQRHRAKLLAAGWSV